MRPTFLPAVSVPCVLGAVLLLTLPTLRADSVADVRRDMQASQAELVKAINESRIAYAADLQARREFMERATQELQAYSQAMRQLQEQLKAMQTRLEAAERRNAELEAQLKRQADAATALVAEEGRQRIAADEKIIRELTKAISTGVRPAPEPAPPAAAAVKYKVYKVVRGDTLTAIGAAFNVSVARLKEFNNLSGETIREGQELRIPEN
jgi:LysM repeat protein